MTPECFEWSARRWLSENWAHLIGAAILIAVVRLVAGCTPSQAKADVELGVITAGCEAEERLEKDAGEAGALEQSERGCSAAIHTWMRVGSGGTGGNK